MKTDKTKLETLFDALAEKMTTKLNSEEVTASDMNVIRMFLHQNGITAIAKTGTPLGQLVESLPFEVGNEEDAQPYN